MGRISARRTRTLSPSLAMLADAIPGPERRPACKEGIRKGNHTRAASHWVVANIACRGFPSKPIWDNRPLLLCTMARFYNQASFNHERLSDMGRLAGGRAYAVEKLFNSRRLDTAAVLDSFWN